MTSELPKLHLIGVGGSGMFPLALLLRQAGYEVSGSDSNCSKERLDLLLANGIRVQAAAMRDVDGVIVSPAIPDPMPSCVRPDATAYPCKRELGRLPN
ncbi:Mur ligase domain-containing protein [Paracoccus cavernae]|uniref:Mur ligase domain-containing protein n=1 Tax=Paracoccus cavernae TaxID=1571207 RepID=A0ABT8D5A1_9RHOB|nr:Mur ligase domain-containing protein [Paracoccus cavernae]